jgi:hypothetical protein
VAADGGGANGLPTSSRDMPSAISCAARTRRCAGLSRSSLRSAAATSASSPVTNSIVAAASAGLAPLLSRSLA